MVPALVQTLNDFERGMYDGCVETLRRWLNGADEVLTKWQGNFELVIVYCNERDQFEDVRLFVAPGETGVVAENFGLQVALNDALSRMVEEGPSNWARLFAKLTPGRDGYDRVLDIGEAAVAAISAEFNVAFEQTYPRPSNGDVGISINLKILGPATLPCLGTNNVQPQLGV